MTSTYLFTHWPTPHTHTPTGPQEDKPPAKRPRLELPSNTHIRVQPLISPSATIASLLHKKPSVASNHSGSNTSTNFTPTNTPQSINSTVAQALSALTQALSANSTSINATLSQAVSSQPPTIVSVIPSLMQSTPTSPTSSNPKSFLLQLVQLYKHYQNTGDSDGMERIKKQLNVLVSATQGRNQQTNPLLGALSILSGPSTTIQQQASTGANSLSSRSHTSTVSAGTTVSRPNMHVPPSLLSTQLRTPSTNSRPQTAVTTGMAVTRATNPSPQATVSTALAEQSECVCGCNCCSCPINCVHVQNILHS